MILIKVGGGTATNIEGIINDIKSLGNKIVFFHGASVQRDKLAQDLGYPTKHITSPTGIVSVLTDKKALGILTMAYAGLVNKHWVSQFQAAGVNAIGLSGADGKLLEGIRKKHLISVENNKQKLISDTHTGKVTNCNSPLIKLLLKNNYTPVITQPAITSQGELINTDNDRNLAIIARDLKIKEILVLFEAPGLLKDINDQSSLIPTITVDKLDHHMKYAQGTMKKKLLGAKEAFDAGVKKIYWGDSRIKHPVISALSGQGTTITFQGDTLKGDQ